MGITLNVSESEQIIIRVFGDGFPFFMYEDKFQISLYQIYIYIYSCFFTMRFWHCKISVYSVNVPYWLLSDPWHTFQIFVEQFDLSPCSVNLIICT